MAKKKKYKRRGSRHKDSEYRKSKDRIYDDSFTRSQAESIGGTKERSRNKRVLGREFPVLQTMMTKRGKRVHLVYEDPLDSVRKSAQTVELADIVNDPNRWSELVALCGAGRPNKEFPEGSAVPILAKMRATPTQRSKSSNRYMDDTERDHVERGTVKVTCYKCLKLHYMNELGAAGQSFAIREFSPTNEGNRNKHVMVPQGRKGVFIGDLDESELPTDRLSYIERVKRAGQPDYFFGYDNYFATSPWHPGNEDMRTQPYSLEYVTDRDTKAKLRQFYKDLKTFGSLVKDYMGEEYKNFAPFGSDNIDTVTAFNKLVSLEYYRRLRGAYRAKQARKFYRGKKKNPLIDMNDEFLDGLAEHLEDFYVYSRG